MSAGRIAEIWRHPVKSMAGERIPEAALGVNGVPGVTFWDFVAGESTTAFGATQLFPPPSALPELVPELPLDAPDDVPKPEEPLPLAPLEPLEPSPPSTPPLLPASRLPPRSAMPPPRPRNLPSTGSSTSGSRNSMRTGNRLKRSCSFLPMNRKPTWS